MCRLIPNLSEVQPTDGDGTERLLVWGQGQLINANRDLGQALILSKTPFTGSATSAHYDSVGRTTLVVYSDASQANCNMLWICQVRVRCHLLPL